MIVTNQSGVRELPTNFPSYDSSVQVLYINMSFMYILYCVIIANISISESCGTSDIKYSGYILQFGCYIT